MLLARHGFVWHSDCFDDDLPYVVEIDGRPLVEVPRSTLTDDYATMSNLRARPFGSAHDLLAVWIDKFDVLHRESKNAARLMSLNWHQCMLGRPATSKAPDDALAHFRQHESVWFATSRQVAEFWLRMESHQSKRGRFGQHRP